MTTAIFSIATHQGSDKQVKIFEHASGTRALKNLYFYEDYPHQSISIAYDWGKRFGRFLFKSHDKMKSA